MTFNEERRGARPGGKLAGYCESHGACSYDLDTISTSMDIGQNRVCIIQHG